MPKIVPWTTDESNMFMNLKKAGKPYKEIGELLCSAYGVFRSEDSLKNKWRSTDWSNLAKVREKKKKLVADLTDKEAEKNAVIEKTLANNERFVRREIARTDVIIDNIKSCIYRLPKPKRSDITYTPSTRKKKYTAEHVGIMISDMHVGASYSYDETGGLSQYNLDIFKERLLRLKLALLEIVERHRGMYELPELHIFSLGDVIAGSPGSGAWNDNYIQLDTIQQITEGTHSLRDLLATWSTAFKKINFYGIYGNHGRVGKKGQTKTSDNWDRLCYDMLKLSLSEYDNIVWNIPKTWWLNPIIQGHSFYLCHGDGIRGTTLSGVEKAESKIAGMLEQRLDYFLMGHFHSPAEIQTNSSRVMMNGSFMGGDMYSLRDLGKNSAPEQKIFGIHKKKGITWTYNIYLDGE